MCDNRLKIGKQLQKSTVPNSIIKTDANNEQQYVAPGTAGQILTIVGGVPTWSNPAVVPPAATLVDNGDGTFTYTDGATSFVIDTTDRVLSTVVYNPATQDFTYTWSNGDSTVVDLTSLLNVYNLISGTNTVVTGDGLSTAWQVNGYGVTNNGDGTYNVTTPTGVGNFTIDTNETVTNIVGNNYVNEDGVSQPIVQSVSTTFNGTGQLVTTVNGVSSTPLTLPSDIVTTLSASLDNTNPLAPTLVITYVNEDGSNGVQNVNLAPLLDNTNTTYILVDNSDGTVSLEGSDGSNVGIDVCGIVAANCSTVITSTDGSVTVNGLDLSVEHVVNPDGSITLNDGTVIAAPIAETITTVINTIAGNKIADYTNEAGTVVPINESITSFAAITNGYQFTSENGTVYPFTFLFDNSTPSAPQLLVQLNGVTQSAIPLNSYDVNISTTGGFVLNPLTDTITITETDGEIHVIDLSYLRSTLTSTDGSVQSIISINPDGSINYDLGVAVTYQSCDGNALAQDQKVHQVTNLPYLTGYGVVKLDGVDCFGNNDDYWDLNTVSYTGNRTTGSNAALATRSRVTNGFLNLIGTTSVGSVMSGEYNSDLGTGFNNISGSSNSQTGLKSLISGSNNTYNLTHSLGVGTLNSGTYAYSVIYGFLNKSPQVVEFSSVGGYDNTINGLTNSVISGNTTNITNVSQSGIFGQTSNYTNVTKVIDASQSSTLSGSGSILSVSGNHSITNCVYNIIASQDGSVTNSKYIIDASQNSDISNIAASISAGRNLTVANSNDKLTVGASSQNLGESTSMIGASNTTIPATTFNAYSIGNHNYSVPNNQNKPTVYLPNVVIGASDVTSILAAPTSSTDVGIEGEIRIDANYVYWYKGGQWLRSAGSIF